MPFPSTPKDRDRPWVMRTYAGHSSPAESNALYRRNLEKGQTGLSVAFDLPTQTGYDPDSELAAGEVGKVGVPITSLADMRALFDGIPLDEMNTSMTINATAMWLLGLYQVVAEEHGHDVAKLTGTTQNDIIKEYLSRGTYVFPPGPSMPVGDHFFGQSSFSTLAVVNARSVVPLPDDADLRIAGPLACGVQTG